VTRWSAVFLVLSALWVLALYRHAISAPFLYDDVPQIEQNKALTSWQGLGSYFAQAVPFSTDYLNVGGAFYRPLFWASLALDRFLWGFIPAAFHITNLFLHWLNGLLMFGVLRKLRAPVLLAAATSFIWLGLPINTEAVAWISGRSISLMTVFLLAGLVVAAEYLESGSAAALAGFFLLCCAAVLSYEAGLLLLPLTLLVAFARDGRPNRSWWMLSGAALFADIGYFALRAMAGAQMTTAAPAILSIGLAFFHYLAWIVVPIQMSIDRSSDMPANMIGAWSMAALAGLAASIAIAFYLRRRLPELAAGIAWVMIALLPFCGIIPTYQGMAERYTYVASAGLALVIASVVVRVRRRSWVLALIVIVVGWMGWGAWRLNARVLDWNNEIALYSSSLRATPNSAPLLFNLGVASAEQGQNAPAMDYYQRALAINPRYVSALINLGNLFRRQGSELEASKLLQHALAIDPDNANAWLDFGNVQLQEGNLQAALDAYKHSLELKPASVEANINLGATDQRLGDLESAKRQYERAISIDPSQAASYADLGALLIQQGKLDQAVVPLRKAIELRPNAAAPYFNLGSVYEQKHQYALAAEMYRKTLAIDPGHLRARLGLLRAQNAK